MRKFKNGQSFKSFLKNAAGDYGISANGAFSTFFTRSFLERLAKYNDGSVLVKGSSAETAYLGSFVRGITDLDLAVLGPVEANMDLFLNAIKDPGVNEVRFKLAKEPHRTRTGIIKYSYVGECAGIEKYFGVDVQENYNRLIEKQTRTMPKIFDGDSKYPILAPSFEEYLAEKLCIILGNNKPDTPNTRVKDFYDIYHLHGGNYDPEKLKRYFPIILEKLGKVSLQEATTLNLDREYVRMHQEYWDRAQKSYDFVNKDLEFSDAVMYTRAVIRQLLQENGVEMPVYSKKGPVFIKKDSE